jgi:hypothetical protein
MPTLAGDASITASQAAALGAAFERYAKLEQWDDRVDHADLSVGSQTLGADYIYDDPVSVGVNSGDTTDAPSCLYFATKATAVAVSANVISQMKANGQTNAESTGLVVTVPGPCISHVTKKDGTTTVADHWDAPFKALLTGHVVDDPVLGQFFYVDGQFRCDDPAVPSLAALCSRVG